MINARILGTGTALSGRRVPTAEVVAQALPGRDPATIEQRIGIATRWFVEPGTEAADLGAAALAQALEAAGLAARDLARLIFVTTTGHDRMIPATANAVAGRMGLDGSCDCFDLNNACTGFLTAFDLATRSVATGLGPVAIVVSELFSRYLPVDKPRPYLVMADAAAAAIIGAARPGEGVVASWLRNTASLREQVVMEHPGRTGRPTFLDFQASYDEIGESAFEHITTATRAVLDASGLSLGEIEWFLPHQPNGRMLDDIAGRLGVQRERIVAVVDEIGSVGAASVPFSLDRLVRTRGLRPGDRLLMTAVGAGTSCGALLYRVAP